MRNLFPRLMIGAATSGTGKTLFTSLLGRLLTQKGYNVQPFKCGPDYIDPSYHSLACGTPGRNLDTRLISEDAVTELFFRQASKADISLIEGVMGLFDGAGAFDERGSTAHLSKILKTPVVLLMDVSSTARSAGAIALGFRDFDPEVEIAGFVLNRVASPRHEETVRKAVEARTGLPVLGAIPREQSLSMPERHLGLIPAWEGDQVLSFLDANISLLEKSIDLDQIVEVAKSAHELPAAEPVLFKPVKPRQGTIRIAYALDCAFHFYYEDNLDMFRNRGVDLVPFSPVNDSSLPDETCGIYIGGGYPEIHAAELSENEAMLSVIKTASDKGMPIWGECGGLMYLSEGITDFSGKTFKMAGVFPGRAVMKKGLRALGYYSGKLRNSTWMGEPDNEITGHVFHWSQMDDTDPSVPYQMLLQKDSSQQSGLEDGFYINRSWAGYMHIHFASNPEILDNFIAICRRYKTEQEGFNS